MGRFIDLTGQRFNRLEVLEYAGKYKNKYNGASFICKCDCGKIIIAAGKLLRNGDIQSCGCLRIDRIKETLLVNIAGQRYGRLIAVERMSNTKWKCLCDCGNYTYTSIKNLRSGNTKSCGCLNLELFNKRIKGKNNPNYKHGLSKTKGYNNNICSKRRAKKLNQTPELTENEKKKIEMIYKISQYLGEDWHVDHIHPLSKGGLHHPDNLQIVTKQYNLQKNNKLDFREPEPMEVFRL